MGVKKDIGPSCIRTRVHGTSHRKNKKMKKCDEFVALCVISGREIKKFRRERIICRKELLTNLPHHETLSTRVRRNNEVGGGQLLIWTKCTCVFSPDGY